jgi:hypothetical protein
MILVHVTTICDVCSRSKSFACNVSVEAEFIPSLPDKWIQISPQYSEWLTTTPNNILTLCPLCASTYASQGIVGLRRIRKSY